ncbi:extracellular solute-binding protein [Paenibacillus sp. GCM10027626]|uniref:extracellular solute-binding protein n=1 Tax=Paenibacillus sp. GCM10027626 TaxID=3273411 RepID=UPI0036344BC9
MNQRKTRHLMTAALAFIVVAMTACSSSETGNGKGDGTSPPEPSTGSSTQPTSDNASSDPFAKYDPPIALTTVRIFDEVDKFAPGSTEKNIWLDGYLNELGIKVTYDWTVIGSQPGGPGEQKMNVSIASGSLPDIIPVNAKQLKQLVDSDLVEDLSDYYPRLASPQLKQFLGEDSIALKSGTFGGKLMGLPTVTGSIDSASMIWVRKDWLDKLGLPEPKTMKDVLAISKAFTNNDPDGNNKNDTFGIGLTKEVYNNGVFDIVALLEGYHGYHNQWIKDESGKLVYGGIQPEIKEGLAVLQEMFKNKEIDPEFGVKDTGKVIESLVSGKIGMFFGQHWNAFWPLGDAMTKDPKADWRPYPIVSADDKPAKPIIGSGVTGYFAVKKGFAHPEAIIKLANMYIDKKYGYETGGYDAEYNGTNEDVRWKLGAVIQTDPMQNIDIHRLVKKAIETGDPSVMGKNAGAIENYEGYQKFKKGEMSLKPGVLWSGPDNSALSVLDYYLTNNLAINDEFFGASTETMVQKQSTLDKLKQEVYTRIILGDLPIDEFDKFVSDWKKLGGDEITAEVNEWASSL